jgi:hypothetical protein
MPTWELIAYNTDSRYRDDIRYREYTRSRTRAEAFERIPKIQFSDSGHELIFAARELPPRTRREPLRYQLSDYVREHMA